MPDHVATLLRLLAQGKTLEHAGKHIGVSATTAYRLVQRYGRDANRRTLPRISEQKRRLIAELRRGGKSIYSVARALKVNRSSVRRHERVKEPKADRCPSCGGKTIVLPCPVCEARHLKGIK